nr:O-antigen ligase family protein [uncultured Actinotalea sp.]
MTTRAAAHREPRPPGPWAALVALPFVALVVPAGLVLSGPLQSNGWPARLVAFWCAGMILLGWALPGRRRPGRVSPAEVGLWLMFAASAAALAAAGMRTLSPEEEAGVLRAALVIFPLLIVALGVAQTADRRRLHLVLYATVLALGVSAAVALAQQLTPFTLSELIRPPGFVSTDGTGFGSRGDFTRVKGAAAHPIEFAVLGGALLPLCLHYARFTRRSWARLAAVGALVLVVLAVPLTVSRSGILVVVVSMVVYSVVLTNRQRANVVLIAVMGAVLARAAAPGLLGVIRSIFANAENDDSITGRTEDYALVDAFFAESPWVGHGLGTFRPEIYFFLDNQYLMAVVEGGLVLLVGTILLMLLGVASSRGARRRAVDQEGISLAQAVTAGIAAIAVSGAFFDLFSFGQVTVVFFLLVGVAGALWRRAVGSHDPLPRPRERFRAARAGLPGPTPSGATSTGTAAAGGAEGAAPPTVGEARGRAVGAIPRQGRTGVAP